MGRARSVAPSAGVMTFTSLLNVFDTQSSFDHIFGLNLIMISIIPRSLRQYVTEDAECFASKVLTFCNFCRLHIFYNSV